ncbi:MAG: putative glycoside hydrolase [bacterium]
MLKEGLRKLLPEITALIIFVLVFFGQSIFASFKPIKNETPKDEIKITEPVKVAVAAASHIKTPDFVKGFYMTAGTAMDAKRRAPMFKLLKETELNAVVIDIKDDYGRIAYPAKDPELAKHLSEKTSMKDIDVLIKELHDSGIYVIARLFIFQDRALVESNPKLAVQSTAGGVWKDFKGISWIDAAAEEAWSYNARIARDAYALGFDEIQLDYIRFPSDGNMKLVKYTHFDPLKESRSEVMTRFFKYMDTEVRQKGIPISADLFGFAFWYRDEDLTIGQRIRDAAPYFTALSPMAYPSHYPPGTLTFKNPAEHPYEIVAETLKRGKDIMKEWPEVKWQARPWIQDFDIGADYDKAKVQAQMKAVVDEGGSGWLIWNARNVYTEDAFLAKNNK